MPHRELDPQVFGRRATACGAVAGLGLLLGLSGCAAPPPPPPPTIAKVAIDVARDANATGGGGGAPIIVRLYQLSATSGFEKAEFFRLFNGDTALLGQDLVKKDEYLLAPGAHKEETFTLPDRVVAVGVLAAYREFSSRTWRGVAAIPPHATTPVTVTVGAAGLVVK